VIETMENINMQSWLPAQSEQYAGWHLRLSGGYSRRANSVYTHTYDQSVALDDAIDHCETVFAEQNIRITFRLTHATKPADLALQLEKRGYRQEVTSIVKSAKLENISVATHPEFSFSTHFEKTWLDDYMQFNQVDPSLYESHKGIISRMPHCYYGRIGDAALGLMVRVGNWVAFHDVVVKREKRGKGYGKALMQSLLHHAKKAGATQTVLSVEDGNLPAIGLYDGIGYRTSYRYWYYRK